MPRLHETQSGQLPALPIFEPRISEYQARVSRLHNKPLFLGLDETESLSPGLCERKEHWCNVNWHSKTDVLRDKLYPKQHFVHHKSYTHCPVIELRTPLVVN
jgi:hypothetical protein